MEFLRTVHFRPESESEIAIWWDFDGELAEIIPATPEAVLEWIDLEAGGHEIEGGYFMDSEPSALDGAGHAELGKMVAEVVENYNRPHTVAYWTEVHGPEEAARLEAKFFGDVYGAWLPLVWKGSTEEEERESD